MTLEDYLRAEYGDGKIDFSMRIVRCHGPVVMVYIHPNGKSGTTTPTLLVSRNEVSLAPGCFSPDWNTL